MRRWLNFWACVVHTSMVFIVLWFAYWRWDRSIYDTQHVMVRIYRFSQVPTQEMIDANLTKWSENWSNSTLGGRGEFFLIDNNLPINFASLTLSFFAISAVFHFLACVAGAFESCWHSYWRQIDDAFPWWRWVEYSGSASVMAMAIAISIGIREQSIVNQCHSNPPRKQQHLTLCLCCWQLAGIFMLHATTMAFGFLTEYISVPKSIADNADYKHPVGAYQFEKWRAGVANYGRTDYRREDAALKLISQSEWEADRPLWDVNDTKRMVSGVPADGLVRTQRCYNFTRRMCPHALGYFPMFAAWVILLVRQCDTPPVAPCAPELTPPLDRCTWRMPRPTWPRSLIAAYPTG